MTITWEELECVLIEEFRSILSHFKAVEPILSSNTRTDFLGLLHFIMNDRIRFRTLAQTEFFIDPKELNHQISLDNFDVECFVETVLNSSTLLPSFSPEFSVFPLLLQKIEDSEHNEHNEHSSSSRSSSHTLLKIVKICEIYWNNRYPSLKESFIIPFLAHPKVTLDPSTELADRVKRRLLKGKLAPFDQSITLAQRLHIQPEQLMDGYADIQLATLREILLNHARAEDEITCVLKQSGCHCD